MGYFGAVATDLNPDRWGRIDSRKTSEIVDSAMNSSSSEVRTQVDGIEHTKREKFAVRI
jgi:hypothetical protein